MLSQIISCLQECAEGIQSQSADIDLLISRLESLYFEVQRTEITCYLAGLEFVAHAIDLLEDVIEQSRRPGRPTLSVDMTIVEHLLSMNFRATMIAKMFNVSIRTMRRKLKAAEISVRQSYSSLSREDLSQLVFEILQRFPNTGFKRMQGFLLNRGHKISQFRVRDVLREVDPYGVYLRGANNRAIYRREYYVEYSNEVWHIDTYLKLIRWKFVVRGGIDGKSRNCVYLEAGTDNTAESNYRSFMKAVEAYGVPWRVRSDKGGENVDVARFMLRSRGLGRSSHICGRSVHNQRIERFWRDVTYGCTGFFKNVFLRLEECGSLNVEDDNHIEILHYIFLPRLNNYLTEYMDAWNNHPLSSESNRTPQQLMLINLPPPSFDMIMSQSDIQPFQFTVEDDTDLHLFNANNEVNPFSQFSTLTGPQIQQLQAINPLSQSEDCGCDLFNQAIRILQVPSVQTY